MGQSWSGIRKILEHDRLCEVLKGRVRYFLTKYNSAHDESGRFAVLVDDVEVIRGNQFLYYQKYLPMENQLKKERGIPRRQWNGHDFDNEEENNIIEKEIESLMLEYGEINVWHFTRAIEDYLNSSINDSLYSENPFVRMFAILDRRVGKRTLKELSSMIEKQPDWLKYFYMLRLHEENIPV